MWWSREHIAEAGGMKGRWEIGVASEDPFLRKLSCEAREKPGRIEHLEMVHICLGLVVYLCVYAWPWICACVCMCSCVCIYLCVFVGLCVSLGGVCVCVWNREIMCVYLCLYVWLCLYISVCLSGCVVCVCGECVKWKRLDCIPKLRVSGKGEGTRKVH